jgi:hypothetical protein
MTLIYEYNNDITNFDNFDEFKKNIGSFIFINFLFQNTTIYDEKKIFKESYSFHEKPVSIENLIKEYKNFKIILFYAAWATDNMYENKNFVSMNIYDNEHFHVLKFSDSSEMYEYLKN